MAEEREGIEVLGAPPRGGWARMVVELHVTTAGEPIVLAGRLGL